MKKVISVIIALVFSIGMFLGGFYTNSYLNSNNKEKPEVSSSRIAVVIEDNSSLSDVDYSKDLYNKLLQIYGSKNYDFVSMYEAKAGLKDNKYGGILKIPADLSSKIVSMGTQSPEKIKLEYMVGENLDQKSYKKSYQNIIRGSNLFNDTISFAYINSIFDDVKKGQNNINYIFNNNLKDLNSAKELSIKQYIKEIQLSDFPAYNFEPISLDLSKHIYLSDVNALPKSILEKYDNFYNDAFAEEETNINLSCENIFKDDGLTSNLIENKNYINQIIEQLNILKDDMKFAMHSFNVSLLDLKIPKENVCPLDPNGQPIPEIGFTIEDYLPYSPPKYTPNCLAYGEPEGGSIEKKELRLKNYHNALERYHDSLDDYTNKTKTWAIAAEETRSKIYNSNIYLDPPQYDIPLTELEDILAERENIFNNDCDNLKAEIDNLEVSFKKLFPLNLKTTMLQSSSFYNDTNAILSNFSTDFNSLKTDVNTANSTNNKALLSAFNINRTFAEESYQKILQSLFDTQGKLNDSVKTFYTLKTKNSNDTQKRLRVLSHLLVDNNNESIIKRQVTEFCAQPVTLTYLKD